MANDQIIFALPDIGRMIRYPYAELSREQNQGKKAFSYYRRSWLYEAADEFFRTRDEAAFRAAPEKRLAAGKGATKKKLACGNSILTTSSR